MTVVSDTGTKGSGTPMAALLRVAAAFEVATAAGLLIAPALILALLFGETPETAWSPLLACLLSAPLLTLSIMCWGASSGPGGRAASSPVAAVLLYNVIVAALLIYAGMILGLVGIALWPAVVAHALLAGWCITALLQERKRAADIIKRRNA
jgi:hypothetical protein